MWSSVASYIWGAGEEAQEEPQAADALHRPASPDHGSKLKTRAAHDEWVLVDNNSRESSPVRGQCPPRVPDPHGEEDPLGSSDLDYAPLTPNSSCSGSPCSVKGVPGRFRRPSPPADVMLSSQSDTCSDVSTLPDTGSQETWLVTPPPCFTAGSLSALETSSMENLLIEHPSMSVYVARGRQNSEGTESHSESDCDEDSLPAAAAIRAAHAVSVRMPPRRPRAVAQRAGLVTPSKRAVQLKTRASSRTSIQRQNMVRGPQYARRSARIVQPSARGMRC